MMEDTNKKETIREIFNNMSYGNNVYSTDAATDWLKSAKISDQTSDVDNVLTSVNNEVWTASCFERTNILIEFAKEIEKNVDLIAQIEIFCRGILPNETKESVKLISEYLKYYSSFAIRLNEEQPNWKPTGVSVGVFDDENILWAVGLILGPALAAGYSIVLHTSTKLSVVYTLLKELAVKSGIPDYVLTIVPSDEYELDRYLKSDAVAILAIFTDLAKDRHQSLRNQASKKVINFASYNTPVVIFEDADLDSAVESVIGAAWSYNGTLPWAVNTILIQENVFENFADKLKNKLKSVRIGRANDKSADISIPANMQLLTNLMATLKLAEEQGVEVYQANTGTKRLVPTLIIGSKVRTNNVLTEDVKDYTVTLLAFRSVSEAINLASNSRQGIGVSVWAENIGVVNEVVGKLKVSNIWVNSHGLTTPDISITPLKFSGNGCFGGEQGFYEYIYTTTTSPNSATTEIPAKIKENVVNAVNSAKKAQLSWSKTSVANIRNTFLTIADYQSQAKVNTSKIMDTWQLAITKLLSHKTNYLKSCYFTNNGYNVMSTPCPRGVLAIEIADDDDIQLNLVLAAVYYGNAVIVLNRNTKIQARLEAVSKQLPSGILTVFPYFIDNVASIIANKELNKYLATDGFNEVLSKMPLSDSKIVDVISGNMDHDYNKVCYAKNVWTTSGVSF